MLGGSPMGMMWSHSSSPDKPKLKRKAEWRRIGALFLPYWKQEALVIACIIVGSLLGLLPPLFTLELIDHAIPSHYLTAVELNVGGMVLAAVASGVIGVYQGYLNSVVGEG